MKNPDDAKFWVIDEEAAKVVRRVFQMRYDGYGIGEISSMLTADGILTPMAYWQSKGIGRGGKKPIHEPTNWRHSTIASMLALQEYCGDVINFKTFSKSYKMKKRIANDEKKMCMSQSLSGICGKAYKGQKTLATSNHRLAASAASLQGF